MLLFSQVMANPLLVLRVNHLFTYLYFTDDERRPNVVNTVQKHFKTSQSYPQPFKRNKNNLKNALAYGLTFVNGMFRVMIA